MRISRFIRYFTFSLLFCFVLNAYGGNSGHSKKSLQRAANTESTCSIQESAAYPVCRISKEVSHIIPANPTTKTSFKNWAVSVKAEALLQSFKFNQYHFYFRHLRSVYKNTDLIFPFHDHW